MTAGSNQVMLDLETMGTGPEAAIVAIGAVRFDESGIRDRFHRLVSLESSTQWGLEMDPSTVLWWLKQSGPAREQFEKPALDLINALERFAEWTGVEAVIWGNGVDFDNVILASAYRATGLDLPWRYWSNRCYRTIKNLFPDIILDRIGTYHCAVDDAESQALHLIRICVAKGIEL